MRFFKFFLSLSLVLNLFFIINCNSQKINNNPKDKVLAYVYDEPLYESELQKNITEYINANRQYIQANKISEVRKQLKNKFLQSLIEYKIIKKNVSKSNIKVSEKDISDKVNEIKKHFKSLKEFNDKLKAMNTTEQKLKDNIKEQLTIQNFIEKNVIVKKDITKDEVESYYNKNKEKFIKPETVTAAHILILVPDTATPEIKKQKMEKIKKILSEVKSGKSFEEMAKKYSEGPSGKNGGSLGEFGRRQMVPPFEKAAFSLKENQISDIVTTRFGYHIIKVYKHNAAKQISLDDVQIELKNQLENQQKQDSYKNWMDKEKKLHLKYEKTSAIK